MVFLTNPVTKTAMNFPLDETSKQTKFAKARQVRVRANKVTVN